MYCMGCGRSKQMDPWHIAKDLGALPFGMLMGKFMCRRCEARLSVVLPWYAATPEQWAKTYRPPSQRIPPAKASKESWDYQVECWDGPNHARILDRWRCSIISTRRTLRASNAMCGSSHEWRPGQRRSRFATADKGSRRGRYRTGLPTYEHGAAHGVRSCRRRAHEHSDVSGLSEF